MAKNTKLSARNQLRIIAGKWRGRKIQFADLEDLRPTPNRVRETVFNWIQNDVAGKNCLDLFAGSGALGVEALSRAADRVTFVEAHPIAVEQLRLNLATLHVENSQVVSQDAFELLQQKSEQRYGIIFLDPPYKMRALEQCIELIEKNHWIEQQGFLYFEQPKQEPDPILSSAWLIYRKKSAGNINYYLAIFRAV